MSGLLHKRDWIEQAYVLCVIVAFGLLFFANAEAQETPDGTVVELGIGKLFYIPCILSFMFSLLLNSQTDAVDNGIIKETNPILYGMILTCIFSVIFNLPQNINTMAVSALKFIAAIVCFKDLRIISPTLFIKYLTVVSPIIILPHYFLTNPFAYGTMRYGGFYGDPNFLAIALNFLITICYLGHKLTGNILIKIVSVISIIGAIPLVLFGVSRAGIAGLTLVLFFIMRDLYKGRPKIFSLVLIILLFSMRPIISQFGETFDFISTRFSNETESDAGGAYARVEVMRGVLKVFCNRPEYIPFGIGPGNTMAKIQEYRLFGYDFAGAVHNTFFLVLYEMGLFCMLLYTWLYYVALRNLFQYKSYLLFGLLLSTAFCLATLPGIPFMPAWVLLFFLLNPRIINYAGN